MEREVDVRNLTYAKMSKLMGYKSHKSISYKMSGEQRFTDADKVKLVEIFNKLIEYLLAIANDN